MTTDERLIALAESQARATASLVEIQRNVDARLAKIEGTGSHQFAVLERILDRMASASEDQTNSTSDIKAHISTKTSAFQVVGWIIAGCATIGAAGVTALVAILVKS
ncbi:MAG: hypothetical protein ACKVW3_01830 [Phycisphaerales bacterium]